MKVEYINRLVYEFHEQNLYAYDKSGYIYIYGKKIAKETPTLYKQEENT